MESVAKEKPKYDLRAEELSELVRIGEAHLAMMHQLFCCVFFWICV